MGGGSDFLSNKRRKYLPFSCKVRHFKSVCYVPQPDCFTSDAYIIGTFQNGEMVDSMRAEVYKAFRFPPFEDERNKAWQRAMEGCNSVGIHFRKRKDYCSNVAYKGICEVDYYQKAIEIMRQKVDNPKFFMFTDNPQWVAENIKGVDYQLVDTNPIVGRGLHLDMQLMACCRHNIIANSTYSWWGAYLNPNPEKTVIAPVQWLSRKLFGDSVREKHLAKGWMGI